MISSVAGSSARLLDGVWEATPISDSPGRASGAFEAARSWTSVSIPDHWQLRDAYAGYEGYVLYRHRFESISPSNGEMFSLRFGGVYYACRAWLNGTYLGAHEGYFAPF